MGNMVQTRRGTSRQVVPMKTPRKTNMEPKNHPSCKGKIINLPNLQFFCVPEPQQIWRFIWVFPKKKWYPKMDGENNGNPYEQIHDLGLYTPYSWFNTHIVQMNLLFNFRSFFSFKKSGLPKKRAASASKGCFGQDLACSTFARKIDVFIFSGGGGCYEHRGYKKTMSK